MFYYKLYKVFIKKKQLFSSNSS